MEKSINRTNKATLIAAALIITGATAIFGTYAASETAPEIQPGPFACFEQMNSLSDEQKAKMQEAHDLMQAGDLEGAKVILDELGIKPPRPRFDRGGKELENLTVEQRIRLEEARKLMRTGNVEEAKVIFDELGLKGPGLRNGKGFRGWHEKGFGKKTEVEVTD